MSKKRWECTEWKTDKKSVIENKNYIPPKERPDWCKAKNKKFFPQYKCLECDCKFFAYSDSEEEYYLWLNKFFQLEHDMTINYDNKKEYKKFLNFIRNSKVKLTTDK